MDDPPPGYGAARSLDGTWARPCGRQDDDFAVRGDVHVQARLRYGPEARASGCVPDLAFERGLLRFELHPLAVQAPHLGTLHHTVAAAPDHDGGDKHEHHETRRDD